MKIVTRKEDGLVIGAQIAGAGASDMISELDLAIEAGMTAEDIAMTIHAHPTLGEITMEAAEVAIGKPDPHRKIMNQKPPLQGVFLCFLLFGCIDKARNTCEAKKKSPCTCTGGF